MASVYIETSIVSHATAWPSADPQIAVLQKQARDWWLLERPKFELVTSQLVITEASAGDAAAAASRLALLTGLPLVPISKDALELAEALLTEALMPPKAAADALHVATAAVAGVEYLLTQSCRHIANAYVLPRVYALLKSKGFDRLLICTPIEFLGARDNEQQSNA